MERIIVIMRFLKICTTGSIVVETNKNWMAKERIVEDFTFVSLVARI